MTTDLEIKEALESGLSNRQIQAELHTSPNRIVKVRELYNIPLKIGSRAGRTYITKVKRNDNNNGNNGNGNNDNKLITSNIPPPKIYLTDSDKHLLKRIFIKATRQRSISEEDSFKLLDKIVEMSK